MKKTLILLLLAVGGPLIAWAQHAEITPFGGYVFPARWYAGSGSLYFNGNAQYGGIASLGISRVVDISFIYNRIDTKVSPDIVGYTLGETGVSENYYLLGVTKNFRINDILSPFASMNIGGVYMDPKSSAYYSYWFFAVGFDAGVKVYFSKVVGLRLQAQLMMPVQSGGFTFYFSPGGSGSSVYLNSTLVDFGFTGGLIFRIGKY